MLRALPLLLPLPVLASDAAAPGLSGGNYLQAMLALMLIVGLLAGTAWLARKVTGGKGFGLQSNTLTPVTAQGPGAPIGPVGPTTSGRMDPYTPPLLDLGLGGMIGKGRRSPEVVEALRRREGVYFGATGGAAVLLARCVRSSRVVAYEDLGPEAILELRVEGFPLVVVVDALGTDLYETGPREARRLLGLEGP